MEASGFKMGAVQVDDRGSAWYQPAVSDLYTKHLIMNQDLNLSASDRKSCQRRPSENRKGFIIIQTKTNRGIIKKHQSASPETIYNYYEQWIKGKRCAAGALLGRELISQLLQQRQTGYCHLQTTLHNRVQWKKYQVCSMQYTGCNRARRSDAGYWWTLSLCWKGFLFPKEQLNFFKVNEGTANVVKCSLEWRKKKMVHEFGGSSEE